MKQYLDLCRNVLENGIEREDRTGTGVISSFGHQLRFDLREGFPIITTKKIAWRGVCEELRWFLSGSTNVNDLDPKYQHWWKPWADEDGELGPIYGKSLRNWTIRIENEQHLDNLGEIYFAPNELSVDQISCLINDIKNNPNSRRHLLSTWNVGKLPFMNLPPCHGIISQFYVEGEYLSCMTHQRSADLFLGFPINLSSYALLLSFIAKICGLKPKELIYNVGDAHIYKNHIDQIKLQLTREPKELPKLVLDESIKSIDDFKFDNIHLIGYTSHDKIKGDVSI